MKPPLPDSEPRRLRREALAEDDRARACLAQGFSTAAMIHTNRAQELRRKAREIDGKSE